MLLISKSARDCFPVFSACQIHPACLVCLLLLPSWTGYDLSATAFITDNTDVDGTFDIC